MKRHRKTCEKWQSRDKNAVALKRSKDTCEKRYGNGMTNPIHVPEIQAKKAATMKAKYGAENPFSRESVLFERVQSHWDGKDRTAHLPKDNFAKPEIKKKIREYWLSRYGVENSSQVPEIRARQLATNLERYGDEQTLRVKEIRDKATKTILEKYGVGHVMHVDSIVEKVVQTNLERYGVPWTTMNPEVRERMNASQIEQWGTMFFSSDAWANMASASLDKRLESYRNTCIARYGYPHPMQNPDYARDHLKHERRSGPNNIEKKFGSMFPEFLFVGDGTYWRFLPRLGGNKNPDFILPGLTQDHPFRDVKVVVEIFGTYWHSDIFTGKSSVDHENETVAAWADVGMKCIVIWESEFSSLQSLKLKISACMTEKPLVSRLSELKPSCEQVDFDLKDVSYCVGCTDDAREFLEKYHYAGYGRAGNPVYIAILNDSVIGVVKFAPPIRQGVAASLGINNENLMELDRFCIHPAYHKRNFASHFMAKVLKEVKTSFPHVRKLVSFADPRFGHSGTVYRSSNWIDVGKTASSYYYSDCEGKEVNKKTLYEHAKRLSMTERHYANTFGYVRVRIPPKIKFVYDLR
jgi:hypothetical protein